MKIPQYLLLDVDANSGPKCKQIFENVIPNIERHSITDENLVRSLFDNKVNPAYVTHSDTNETISMMQTKLCSNTSNEWILFSILEKETMDKSTVDNPYAMEFLSDGSTKSHQCVSFDFNECSLNKLQIDYTRLFQFSHEQHVKGINTNKKGVPIEIAYIVYHYIRRKTADYIGYKERLMRIISTSLNITIVPVLITYQHILIRVKITQKNVSFINMNCMASLQGNNFNQVHYFQMNNPIILFNQLAASTSYNICTNCQEMNKICKQIKTSSTESSISLQSGQLISAESYIYSGAFVALICVVMVALIIFILFLIIVIVILLKPAIASFRHRQPRSLNLSSTNEEDQDYQLLPDHSNMSDTTSSSHTYIGEEETFVHNYSDTADNSSISTLTGQSVRDLRGSTSTIGPRYLNT